MAISAINSFLKSKKFGENITKKAKAKLASQGVEQYIFEYNLMFEWCSWIQKEVSNYASIDPQLQGYSRRMTAVFIKTLKREFRKAAGKRQGVSITIENNALVITQLSFGMASFQKSGSAASDAITKAKKAAITSLSSSLTPQELNTLASSMWGHHAGVKGARQTTRHETWQGASREGFQKTDYEAWPHTTGGMLKLRKDVDDQRRAEGVASSYEITDFIEGMDHRTEEDALYHAVYSKLSDYIDILLGFDRAPVKMIDTRRNNPKSMGEVEVVNTIPIYFALGTGKGEGKIGSQYTKAFNDWDAGGSGGLSKRIDEILDNVAVGIINDVIKYSGENAIDIAKLGGSPSTIDHISGTAPKKLIQMMFPHATKPDARLKVNKKLPAYAVKMKKGGVEPIKFTGKKGSAMKVIMAKNLPKNTRKTARKSKEKAKTKESPIALRNILNEFLPEMVASKMTSPALRFRTGRFANSARVENVTIGPRGGVGIDFTYQRAPYETFEPGNKQGSTQRDPRKIIGASIRELAMGIIGKQPHTIRRV